MKIVIQLVLWVVIGFLGYMVYESIMGPVRFNKVRDARYKEVIKGLNDIRSAQLAHKTVTGTYAKNFDGLAQFIDTAQFTITQRRDSSFVRFNKILNIDEPKDTIVIDTLGFKPVKDSLFGTSTRYKNLKSVTADNINAEYQMDAGHILKNDIRVPVFEAKIAKDKVLEGMNKDMISMEKQVVSVDGVNGEYISVGSMTDVKTAGNWPKTYGANE